jgi:hypothetical protein
MATVDSDKVVCGGIHAMIVAVLVYSALKVLKMFGIIFKLLSKEFSQDSLRAILRQFSMF